MTENPVSIQQTPETPPIQTHDDEFFKEIEKRAYKGARKAIFHFILMTTLSFILLWIMFAFIIYKFAIPYISNIFEQQLGQINPVDQLQQESVFEQFKNLKI